MNKIILLPDNLISLIAAGEVIQRPASVLKELLENSLDAGAKNINVRAENAGKRLLEVSDDGCGLSPDDAILAFENHATSKLKKAQDLNAITSLGFRGEALASIAAVCKVNMTTAPVLPANKTYSEPSQGTKVVIEGSKIKEVSSIGRAYGTTITTKALFFNTPARRKFLKTSATEYRHLIRVFTHLALAHPIVHFLMEHEQRIIYNLPVNQSEAGRLTHLLGKRISELLHPFSVLEGANFKMHGYLVRPSDLRYIRMPSIFFVNQRPISNPKLHAVLKESYQPYLQSKETPFAVIFLEFNPEKIDVNIHPTKNEIRFSQEKIVLSEFGKYIKTALEKITEAYSFPSSSLTSKTDPKTLSSIQERSFPSQTNNDYQASETFSKISESGVLEIISPPQTMVTSDAEKTSQPSEFVQNHREFTEGLVQERKFEEFILKKTSAASESKEQVLPFKKESFADAQNSKAPSAEIPTPSQKEFNSPYEIISEQFLDLSQLEPLGQIDNTFILCRAPGFLVVIDQHAAHERIIYENLLSAETSISVQQLLYPVLIDLEPGQLQELKAFLEQLKKAGLELEFYSGNTVSITAVPAVLKASDIAEVVSQIIDELLNSETNAADTSYTQLLISIACHSAIRAGQTLRPEEMKLLIKQLAATKTPFVCPHGRPTILKLSLQQLRKNFFR